MMQIRRRYINFVLAAAVVTLLGLGAMKIFVASPLSEPDIQSDELGDTGILTLSDAQAQQLGIKVDNIIEQEIHLTITRPGEVEADAKYQVSIMPGVAGRIQEVHVFEGETVAADTVLAVLDSRDLANVQAEFLNSRERFRLADISAEREALLWQQKVTSEETYLAAQQVLQEARVNVQTAEQALRSLDIDPDELNPDQLGVYRLISPLAGTVVSRFANLGEIAQADTPLFQIANLDRVWVRVQIFPKDLGQIEAGADSTIETSTSPMRLTGKLEQIVPNIRESTRTAYAFVSVENTSRRLSLGQFVSVHLVTTEAQPALLVPESAMVREPSGDWQVFAEIAPNTFQATDIEVIGRTSEGVMISGIKSGARIVTNGAYFLRGELDKSSLVDDD